MKHLPGLALVLAAMTSAAMSTPAATQTLGELSKFSNRYTPGLYQYTVTIEAMEMPGMPAGAGPGAMPPTAFTQCVTQKDIDSGRQIMSGKREGEMQCSFSNVKTTADSANYTQRCELKGGEMVSDIAMQIKGTATVVKSKSNMKMGGHAMKSASTMEMKRIGDCK